MERIDFENTVTQSDHDKLIQLDGFKTIGYQYTIMYMSRVHSQAEFLFAKILSLRGKVFSDYEVSEVVEAFTIKTICDWEWYAEQMICECLQNDTTQLSRELDLSLPNSISLDECLGYLSGLGYFDLKSASNLKTVAKKVLIKERNPFENISAEARNMIDDFYVLRNYVAHRSKKSKKSLIKTYAKYNQSQFQDVGEFLLSKNENGKSKTIRFQNFGSSFWLAAFQILEYLYPPIYKWITQDETVYNDKCHLRFHYLRSLCLSQPK
ncbi:MAG: hypothetical protein M3O71_13585 [Bacteroidota bacterium]|nr:hypothetical protein [Bacteroidota bacterium]